MSFLLLIFGAFNFLNCLFGSEHLFFRIEKIAHFLSCLCGSELNINGISPANVFLSYLHGSKFITPQ